MRGGSAYFPAMGPMPRRLLVDLSEVVHTDYGTGIHRVVRNITRALLAAPDRAWTVVPVAHERDGRCESACGYASRTLQLACDPPEWPIAFAAGDRLLMLDSAWESPERFLSSLHALQDAGGQAGAMVYDLIPLRFPQHCVDFMPPIFERWLRFVVMHCDFLVCISRAVADDLRDWIVQARPEMRRDLRIGHVHLGSGIDEGGAHGAPSDAARAAMAAGDSVLMVGTVEPRKRHDLALDAFDAAWATGATAQLVIAGRQGWNVATLAERIRAHPQAGLKLHWWEHATDADLAHAYARCACLLQASDAEGFGLPIVEAARYGKPLLLSDIPVFREIAGAQATYFTAGDASSLAAALMAGIDAMPAPDAGVAISWAQSATRLLRLLQEESPWDHRFARGVAP